MRAKKAIMTKPAFHGQEEPNAQSRQSTKKYEKPNPILNKLFKKYIKKRNRIALPEFLVYNKENKGRKIGVETLYAGLPRYRPWVA